MAGPSLCLSCVSLPLKERGAAVKRQRCPDCNADIGLTAYGGRFRIPPAKPSRLAPNFFRGAMAGAAIFMFVILMIGMHYLIDDRSQSANPELQGTRNTPIPEELTRIPEVALESPLSRDIAGVEGKRHVFQQIAKIVAENNAKPDGFLLAQMDRRRELRGLPFIMGDACKLSMDRAKSFQTSVTSVRESMDASASQPRRPDDAHFTFWNSYLAGKGEDGIRSEAGLAALTQILAPASMNLRASFVQKLTRSQEPNATKLLARAALFDPSGDVRTSAIKALQDRPKADYTEVLLQGLRYPLAAVAQRTSTAMIMLDRKDLLPNLAEFLAEAAPGDPVEKIVDGQKACTVQEVVRINHHRNCLLCHAPAQTGSPEEVPGLIPSPGSPFPQTTREYYGTALARGEPVVRADTTYLRQDFSVMMPVENAAPWPEMQRFDFLVRTRVVDGRELVALKDRVQQRAADFLSENHQAALRVLRDLTGQNAAPTRAAWQQALAK